MDYLNEIKDLLPLVNRDELESILYRIEDFREITGKGDLAYKALARMVQRCKEEPERYMWRYADDDDKLPPPGNESGLHLQFCGIVVEIFGRLRERDRTASRAR